ncbi:hypothetical protein F5X99DRAFT_125823 [Biscogniauxia marginata]|nr:hypothetical protein F5X99DRAFT_125823 [Biscogniauxia marginata]
MLFTTLLAATLPATAAALPPAPPLVSVGPVVNLTVGIPGNCETEACFYTYSECNGAMSFLSNCFTPCGTSTIPPSYVCDSPTATPTPTLVA